MQTCLVENYLARGRRENGPPGRGRVCTVAAEELRHEVAHAGQRTDLDAIRIVEAVSSRNEAT